MTEALDSFLSDLRRVADAVRSEGHYEPATLMIEAVKHIERLRSSSICNGTSTTDERKERDKHIRETCRQIEDWRAKVEKLQWELRNAETIINQLDAERWALILTP